MKKKKLNYLKKFIDKTYMKNGQRLYVGTDCDLPSSTVSVFLTDKKGDLFKFLFEIDSAIIFEDVDYKYKPRINSWINNKYRTPRLDESISWTPLFSDLEGYSRFVLKKFKPITKEDLDNCLEYFLREILHEYLIFNIEIVDINYE